MLGRFQLQPAPHFFHQVRCSLIMIFSLAFFTIPVLAQEVLTNESLAAQPVTDKPVLWDMACSVPVDCYLADTLSQDFYNRFQRVINEAKIYLLANKVRRRAVVLDLDETLLDNRAYYVIYKTYNPTDWNVWVMKSQAQGIPQTMAFVEWLKKNRFKIYFVSGRLESQRRATVDNLMKIGVTNYDGLYLRPDQYDKNSMSNFKTEAQRDIEKKGDRLLLLLGDQESDMRSALGKGMKLPNPIYTVP